MNRSVCLLIAALFSIGFMVSCTKVDQKPAPLPAPKGELKISLTDAPILYTAVNVNISGLDYHTSADPSVTTGWDSLPLKQRGVVNLLTLQNGDTASLTNTSLAEINLRQLRMRFGVTGNTVVVKGITHPLIIPAEILDKGVSIPVNYSIRSGDTRILWIDFNVSSSIRFDSVNNTYTLSPALRTFEPYKMGRILGSVLPQDAQAVVKVVKDSSNFSTVCYPDYSRGGFFSAVGLDSGSYKVHITPTNPLYRERTVIVPYIYNGNHSFSLGSINLSLLPYISSNTFTGNWYVKESVSILFPDSLVGVDSFYAPTITVNDSTFAIVQTGRQPDPDWVRSWPYANADTLNFTPLTSGNVLKNNLQGNIGTYSTNRDTFQIRYGFGNGNVVYMVSQKWVRR